MVLPLKKPYVIIVYAYIMYSVFKCHLKTLPFLFGDFFGIFLFFCTGASVLYGDTVKAAGKHIAVISVVVAVIAELHNAAYKQDHKHHLADNQHLYAYNYYFGVRGKRAEARYEAAAFWLLCICIGELEFGAALQHALGTVIAVKAEALIKKAVGVVKIRKAFIRTFVGSNVKIAYFYA